MGVTNKKDRITKNLVLLDLCLAIALAIIMVISIDLITQETESISSESSCSTKVCLEMESLMTSFFSLISLTGVRVREVSPFTGVWQSNSGLAGTLEHLTPQGPGCPLVGWLHLEQVRPFGIKSIILGLFALCSVYYCELALCIHISGNENSCQYGYYKCKCLKQNLE